MTHAKGTIVISAKGEQGKLTGGAKLCQMESCGGSRLRTEWPDGKITWPCDSAMEWDEVNKRWLIRDPTTSKTYAETQTK